ncbi:ABC transporter ATP-binding protein [Desulfuromonas thiophila]|uniref:ABC transporter ATP-binding protein n=1 Tax=Desulfuromonas thiophila TaxID=57664 RepID=UPI0024A93E21|nr:oligopeptide/dipeptide ABC transporter ATP-binding protein [Desulfuromonas thiophila]
MDTLLQLEGLTKGFHVSGGPGRPRQWLRAVEQVNLQLRRGETLALVGESGCGKSTLAKLILGLLTPDSGTLRFKGLEPTRLPGAARRQLQRQMQMVFQDPFSSLNPRMQVGTILAEPFHIHRICSRAEAHQRALQLLEEVGLTPDHARRFAHEFSGGQRQRVGIARALALRPELVVADEPVSALDLSIQAQILRLLRDLQQRHQLTYLFISHDLAVVASLASRVALMYLGRVVEIAPVDAFFGRPLHPYGEMLLQALPLPDPHHRQRPRARGEIPSATAPPPGCPFHPRCAHAQPLCQQQRPPLQDADNHRQVACWRAAELQLEGLERLLRQSP